LKLLLLVLHLFIFIGTFFFSPVFAQSEQVSPTVAPAEPPQSQTFLDKSVDVVKSASDKVTSVLNETKERRNT
jgi:hypothetical protein